MTERAASPDPAARREAAAHYNRGLELHRLRRHEEALESYARAIELWPTLAAAHNNRGVVLRDLGRDAEALESYERALALDPASEQAHNNRGVVLREMRRFAEALESYERAIELKPGFAEAHSNRGTVLADLRRHREALQAQERALAIRPGFAQAWVKRGVVLGDLGEAGGAVASLRRALDIDSSLEWVEGLWLHAKMKACDWSGLGDRIEHLARRVEQGERATPPFPLLALPVPAALHRKAAETWVAAHHGHVAPRLAPWPRGERVRVGYFSSDLHEHATSYLIAGMLERHDRAGFEVTAFSFGPDTGDAMRARVAAAVERFVDVRGLTDDEVVRRARELRIDVAVDLKGLTEDARTGIFAMRAAPVQASFLGYPGTIGAPFIDYLVADAIVVPLSEQSLYAERIVHVPVSYQPNDATRGLGRRDASRGEQGLPDPGVVFCCFNNSYKISPVVFEAWMRVMARVPDSVLWLLEDNALAARNLRREAARRGIDAGRLVFAPRAPLAEHMARSRLADLFLDTLPYNAHTTASDALWAGVPVLTRAGDSFAGRVASSLLHAMGLPELVTATLRDYEELAVALATEPDRHAELRRRVESQRLASPLFDPQAAARKLEAAYLALLEAPVNPE